MKKTTIILIAILLIAFGSFLFLRVDDTKTPDSLNNQLSTYSNADLGIEFQYRPGPTGYVVQEMTPSDTTGELVRTLVVIRTDEVDSAPEGGEGPPTITIQVLKNTQKQWPQTWADTHHIYSNINLKMGDVTETAIGGAKAIRYMADGLYASDVAVITQGDYIYVISGMFMDENSAIKRDFQPLLDSIRFIPTP